MNDESLQVNSNITEQKVPVGYKKSAAGLIPYDWNFGQLKDIVDFANGRPHERDIVEGGRYQLITLDSIGIDGSLKSDHKHLDTFDHSLKRNDIVAILSDIAHGDLLGLCDVIPADNTYVLNQRVARLRIKKSADPQFVRWQINRRQGHFKNRGQGTSQRHVYRRDFDCLWIPLPSEREQRVIADALSNVDELLTSIDALIAKKRAIKQSAMQQLLTGKIRLPGFGGHWDVRKLGELLSIMHGKSQVDVVDAAGSYPILATSGEIGRASKFLYDKPSVLIGRKGTIDRPQYMDSPFWSVDTLFYSIVHAPNSAKYLYYRFCFIDWLQYNEASGVPSLNSRTIEQIEVEIPRSEEQAAIAAVISDFDDELAAIETRRDKVRDIQQGMMQQLLTGRIRLVRPPPEKTVA